MDFLNLPWKILLTQGVIAAVFGVVAMVWPEPTTITFVVIWGVWAFLDGVSALMVAASVKSTGARVLYGCLGVIGLIAAGFAVLRPIDTVSALTWILGIWLIARGAIEVVAILLGRRDGMLLLGLAGAALSVAAGVLFAANPGAAAVSIAWLLGLIALLWGVVFVIAALVVRHAVRSLPEGTVSVTVTEVDL